MIRNIYVSSLVLLCSIFVLRDMFCLCSTVFLHQKTICLRSYNKSYVIFLKLGGDIVTLKLGKILYCKSIWNGSIFYEVIDTCKYYLMKLCLGNYLSLEYLFSHWILVNRCKCLNYFRSLEFGQFAELFEV